MLHRVIQSTRAHIRRCTTTDGAGLACLLVLWLCDGGKAVSYCRHDSRLIRNKGRDGIMSCEVLQPRRRLTRRLPTNPPTAVFSLTPSTSPSCLSSRLTINPVLVSRPTAPCVSIPSTKQRTSTRQTSKQTCNWNL